jgi:cell division protein FtsB
MEEKSVNKIVLQAMAEKIDRLNGELFCKDFEIEKLKAENESLKRSVENLKKALVGEDE